MTFKYSTCIIRLFSVVATSSILSAVNCFSNDIKIANPSLNIKESSLKIKELITRLFKNYLTLSISKHLENNV